MQKCLSLFLLWKKGKIFFFFPANNVVNLRFIPTTHFMATMNQLCTTTFWAIKNYEGEILTLKPRFLPSFCWFSLWLFFCDLLPRERSHPSRHSQLICSYQSWANFRMWSRTIYNSSIFGIYDFSLLTGDIVPFHKVIHCKLIN